MSATHMEEVKPDHQCPHGWMQFQWMGFVGCTCAATEQTDKRRAHTLVSIQQLLEFINNNPEQSITNYVDYIHNVQQVQSRAANCNDLFVVPSHLNKSLMYSLGYHHLKQLDDIGARLA